MKRPPLRLLVVKDPWHVRAREALGRLLVRLGLRRPRKKFADLRAQPVLRVRR